MENDASLKDVVAALNEITAELRDLRRQMAQSAPAAGAPPARSFPPRDGGGFRGPKPGFGGGRPPFKGGGPKRFGPPRENEGGEGGSFEGGFRKPGGRPPFKGKPSFGGGSKFGFKATGPKKPR